jgi:hypothetical protein
MQRLGRSLIDSLRLAAQRVSSAAPASSSLLHDAAAVRAVEPQAAFARWNSTAAVASSSSTASATANAPRKTDPHHTLKRSLVPATSGRNAFHRGWAKRLQIKASLSPLFVLYGI